ncbi:hypothetical protein LPJ81_001438 [Coemansia sp. IMI 209127]|nr:hypothetical protein LPJ81_001438 [Coemansia sp. IMI 209127]
MGKTKNVEALADRREERLQKKLAKVQKKNEKKQAAAEREPKKRNKEKHNNREGGEKKLKKNKKKKEKTDRNTENSLETTGFTPAPTPVSDKASDPGWNNWSDAQFESEERKNKFLRFMGVKKPTEKVAGDEAATTSTRQPAKIFDSAISKDYEAKVQRDLEKQFSAGIAMRQQTQRGARGGLGF